MLTDEGPNRWRDRINTHLRQKPGDVDGLVQLYSAAVDSLSTHYRSDVTCVQLWLDYIDLQRYGRKVQF